jgi:outer membrane protein assembly factor BamD (BamD/ComL family)
MALPAAAVVGQDQPKITYQERLEYDAATGQWVELAPPIPGTEEGDLALARAYLAHGQYEEAREAFEAWFETYPESAHRPEALFYAAETEISAEDLQPRSGDVMQAYDWLEELLDGWPGGDLSERAMRKELIIAELLLFKDRKQKVWKGMLWLSAQEEAVMMLDRLIDERAPDTQIAEQALRIKADYHYQDGDYEEAEISYARLMREHARGRYAKLALLRAGESALARFPGVEFDEADLLEAEVYLKDFKQKYPDDAGQYKVPQILTSIDDRRAEKDYRVGRYYERVGRLDAAAYYYRLVVSEWEATTWAQDARNRLIAIGAIDPTANEQHESYEDDVPVTMYEGLDDESGQLENDPAAQTP